MRYFIHELPEDQVSAIVNTGDDYGYIYAFSDEFIEWCNNVNGLVQYQSRISGSRKSSDWKLIPVCDATMNDIIFCDAKEDSIVIDDDETNLLFKLTWL